MIKNVALYIISHDIFWQWDKSILFSNLVIFIYWFLGSVYLLPSLFAVLFWLVCVLLEIRLTTAIIIIIYLIWGDYFISYSICNNITNIFIIPVTVLAFINVIFMFRMPNNKQGYADISTKTISSIFLFLKNFVLNLNKRQLICLLSFLMASRVIRSAFIYTIFPTGLPLICYIFCLSTFVIPTIILYRALYNVMHKILCSKVNTSIMNIILEEGWNANNYKISNINVAHLIAALSTLLTLGYSLTPGINLWDKPFSADYQDFSLPGNFFARDFIQLNGQHYTINDLRRMRAISIPHDMGEESPRRDYRFLVDGKPWVRSNDGLYYLQSNAKARFTATIQSRNLISQHIGLIHGRYPFNTAPDSFRYNQGIRNAMTEVSQFPDQEWRVDGLVATLLPLFFDSRRGFHYVPQYALSDDTAGYAFENEVLERGKADFVVKFNGNLALIVESKSTSLTASSWLNHMHQARNYAIANNLNDSVFVLLFRGTCMSGFIYQQDFHSDHKFDMKCSDYQDFIGIEATGWGLSLIPQSNVFGPQMKIYDLRPPLNNQDTRAISDIVAGSAILSYIAESKVPGIVDHRMILPSHNGQMRQVGTAMHAPGQSCRLMVNQRGLFQLL